MEEGFLCSERLHSYCCHYHSITVNTPPPSTPMGFINYVMVKVINTDSNVKLGNETCMVYSVSMLRGLPPCGGGQILLR